MDEVEGEGLAGGCYSFLAIDDDNDLRKVVVVCLDSGNIQQMKWIRYDGLYGVRMREWVG